MLQNEGIVGMPLTIKPKQECRWDLVALGEVMLRFDPGDRRVSTTRHFEVSEGGGEYNVARGLKRCFGLETAIVTAIADNSVGRLLQDLIYQGGVDQSFVRWVEYDGVGRCARNGLNFTERGHGVRAALGCSDRGHTAISQLKAGDIDWDEIFGKHGARWFHTGGIFCALSATTPEAAVEAIRAAKKHGTIVSYDLNYRASLWKAMGGKERARDVNRRIVPSVDVVFGNEEDFSAALGFEVKGIDESLARLDAGAFEKMIEAVVNEFRVPLIATTLREAHTATLNGWGAICYADGSFYRSKYIENLEIFDRVGGGDSFASGLIYGLLAGKGPQWAVDCGVAHGALAMTTPGDTSMATFSEVLQLMSGASARIAR